MKKHLRYISDNTDYSFHFINKKFGGNSKKLLIEFYYRDQVGHYKQGFLAYVSKTKFEEDSHSVIEEIQNYLIDKIGVIDHNDFRLKEIDCDKCNSIETEYHCREHYKDFMEWEKRQFPKINLYYGGVSYFGIVKDD